MISNSKDLVRLAVIDLLPSLQVRQEIAPPNERFNEKKTSIAFDRTRRIRSTCSGKRCEPIGSLSLASRRKSLAASAEIRQTSFEVSSL